MEKLDNIRDLYLDLMKKTLTHSLWVERTRTIDPGLMPKSIKKLFVQAVTGSLGAFHLGIVKKVSQNAEARTLGEDWPEYAHTMIGFKRLDNIRECIESIIGNGIPGDLIETGVWRGGAVIFMRALLKAHGITDRIVWAADSFEGLPKPDRVRYPADKDDICYQREFTSVSIDEVKRNFSSFGLLDDQVRFLKGWFQDTLPTAPIEKLALLRLDGDMYQSTMESLVHLYPKLSVGGFVIVDDYAAGPCKQAVQDYRSRMSITDEIVPIDNWSVYWSRG